MSFSCVESCVGTLVKRHVAAVALTCCCCCCCCCCCYCSLYSTPCRDLKSLNVLVTADDVLKVCDFGSSRALYVQHTHTYIYIYIYIYIYTLSQVPLACMMFLTLVSLSLFLYRGIESKMSTFVGTMSWSVMAYFHVCVLVVLLD
jgi:hypothetical protein